MMNSRLHTLLALSLLVPACASAGSEEFVAGVDGGGIEEGEGEGEGQTDAGAPVTSERAVVISVNRSGNTNDTIEVWKMDREGALIRGDLSFGPIDNPRRVAMRPDGREALCAWGRLGGEYGVTVLGIEPDGSAAEVLQTIVLGTGKNVFGLEYASNDHAIMAASSSGDHRLIALDRGEDGHLSAGQITPVENDWPLEILRGPDETALVHRGFLLDEPATEIIPLAQTVEGWSRGGSSGFVNPASIHAVVSGQTIYSATADPNDSLSELNPDSDGILHRYSYDGGDVVSEAAFPLPDTGTMIAADPNGGFLVVPETVFEFSQAGIPNARGFRWMTIGLDEAGAPTDVSTDETVFPSLLFNSTSISPDGILLAAYTLYEDQAPAEGQTHPVQGFSRDSGAWLPVGEPVFAGGITQMVLANP